MQMGTSISRARQRHAELDVRKAKQRYAKLGRETPSYAELRRATQRCTDILRDTQSHPEAASSKIVCPNAPNNWPYSFKDD